MISKSAHTERCLTAIAAPDGEGARAFTQIYAEAAAAEALAADRRQRSGQLLSRIDGAVVAVKDLFDVAGQTTWAGSVVLRNESAAAADAPAVASLRRAGTVIVGKTNMTEFAYSGLGLNPHFGTPANPFQRHVKRRIPGGSSSGAAIAVTDGMADIGLGTDTGGSVRIPAALNGLTGFKPTQRRVPLDGAFPLSSTLDSIGPLANSLACCAIVDAVIAGEEPVVPAPIALRGLRLAVPQHYVIDGLEPAVARCFEDALRRLSDAGALIVDLPFAELEELPSINAKGGFSAAECYAKLREVVATDSERIDARVLARIVRGAGMSGPDYVDLIAARASLIARAAALTAPFDALAMPTVALTAPPIAALADDREYGRVNLAILRNPSVVNFLDRCALTLPCHRPGEAPVGFSLMGEHLGDRRLIGIGLACEAVLRRE